MTVSETPSVPNAEKVTIDSSAIEPSAPRLRVEISCGPAFRVKDSKGSSSVESNKSERVESNEVEMKTTLPGLILTCPPANSSVIVCPPKKLNQLDRIAPAKLTKSPYPLTPSTEWSMSKTAV